MVTGVRILRSDTSTSTSTFPSETIARRLSTILSIFMGVAMHIGAFTPPKAAFLYAPFSAEGGISLRRRRRHFASLLEPRLADGQTAVAGRSAHVQENLKSIVDQVGDQQLPKENALEDAAAERDTGDPRVPPHPPCSLDGSQRDRLVELTGKGGQTITKVRATMRVTRTSPRRQHLREGRGRPGRAVRRRDREGTEAGSSPTPGPATSPLPSSAYGSLALVAGVVHEPRIAAAASKMLPREVVDGAVHIPGDHRPQEGLFRRGQTGLAGGCAEDGEGDPRRMEYRGIPAGQRERGEAPEPVNAERVAWRNSPPQIVPSVPYPVPSKERARASSRPCSAMTESAWAKWCWTTTRRAPGGTAHAEEW